MRNVIKWSEIECPCVRQRKTNQALVYFISYEKKLELYQNLMVCSQKLMYLVIYKSFISLPAYGLERDKSVVANKLLIRSFIDRENV